MSKSRAQTDMELAEKLVSELKGNDKAAKIYGGLCHSFPVMVRTCGLCQALAFSESKKAAGEGRGEAHEKLLEHVAKLLDKQTAASAVQQMNASEYMFATRRVLAAWIYFKRFAVSILKVETAGDQQ